MDDRTLEYKIVTSATKKFIPGLVALRNSIQRNFPEAELYCYYFGDWEDELPTGVTYFKNVKMAGRCYGIGEQYREGLVLGEDMYARLMIPEQFHRGKVMYVDCDCLVLHGFQELWEIDLKQSATACVFRPDIGWKGGNVQDFMASGTFLCDVDKWRKYKIMEKSFQAMNREGPDGERIEFSLNVESVMSYIHKGDFYHLPAIYQNLTYYGALTNYDKIAHFAGPKPWHIEEHTFNRTYMNYEELWRAYYENNEVQIITLTKKLPGVRRADHFTRIKDTSII